MGFSQGLRLKDLDGDVEHALTALRQYTSMTDRGTSWLINDVAEAMREQGRYEEAKTLFAESLAARRAAYGDADPAIEVRVVPGGAVGGGSAGPWAGPCGGEGGGPTGPE